MLLKRTFVTGAHGQAAFAEAAGPLAMHVCMSGLVEQNQSMYSWHNLMRDTLWCFPPAEVIA